MMSKQSLNKQSLNKQSLNKQSLNKQSLNKQNFNESNGSLFNLPPINIPPIKPPRKKPSPRLTLKSEIVRIPEKIREKNIDRVLTDHGYRVMHIGKPIPVTCSNPACRKFQWARTTGNTVGVADCLITHPTRWPGVWQMLEIKGQGTLRRPDQIDLVDTGLSTFVITEEDAVAAILAIEQRMGIEPNPRLLRWQRTNAKGVWIREPEDLAA